MPQDDNNKKNNGGSEDIFEIMEKYRAEQAAKRAEEEKRASDAVKPAPAAAPAKKTVPVKKPVEKAKKKAARFSLSSIFAKKKKPAKPAPAMPEGTHGPRPVTQDLPGARVAKINDSALKTHFSDNAHIGDDTAFTESRATDLSAHLSDAASEVAPQAEESVKKSSKTVAVLKKIWYVLTNISFLGKAIIYVAVVLILSAYVSYFAITVANDVFAFVKTDREITVNIPEGATDKEIAYLLKKNGLINYSEVFELYLIYKGDPDDPLAYIPGDRTLNATMNYSQLIAALTTDAVVNEQVSITIPEGYTVDQIIDLLVSNGVGTREGYVDAINNYPYKHEFVTELVSRGYPASRKYRLEGYLYPDTYFFYKTSDEYIVINKMLNNFQEKFWSQLSAFKEGMDKFGMTGDDIVTLASMVQSEAKLYIDFEAVSYVFHNRLSHPGTFPCLQSDATIQYILTEHVEDFTQEQLDTDNPYNTYKYAGLPPGAICNPGFDALSAAVYPDAPVDSNGLTINAYYFVSNKAGTTYYAETKAQHDRNKQTVAKDNEAYEKNS